MIYFTLVLSVIFFALLYNRLKYSNAKFELEKINNNFRDKCKKNSDIKLFQNNLTLYNKLSKREKLFLDNFSIYMGCDNLSHQLNIKMYNIFCLNKDKIKRTNQLNKLAYKFKNYYCTSEIYLVLDFIDELYHKYTKNNKSIDFKLLNTNLFAKENIDDDELLKIILNMTLKEFIATFYSLLK